MYGYGSRIYVCRLRRALVRTGSSLYTLMCCVCVCDDDDDACIDPKVWDRMDGRSVTESAVAVDSVAHVHANTPVNMGVASRNQASRDHGR